MMTNDRVPQGQDTLLSRATGIEKTIRKDLRMFRYNTYLNY